MLASLSRSATSSPHYEADSLDYLEDVIGRASPQLSPVHVVAIYTSPTRVGLHTHSPGQVGRGTSIHLQIDQ